MPGSSSVETIARLSAYAKPGADGSRSTAITKRPRAPRGAQQADLRRPGA